MGKKTGQKTQILLRLDKEPDLLQMFEKIKRATGIHSNADLIRTLINQKYEELKREPSFFVERFELINHDDNGAKVHDREMRRVADLYFRRDGIWCDLCERNACEHIAFSLTDPDILELVRKRRKEGWKLPDV